MMRWIVNGDLVGTLIKKNTQYEDDKMTDVIVVKNERDTDVVFSEFNSTKRAEMLFPAVASKTPRKYEVSFKTKTGEVKKGWITLRPAADFFGYDYITFDILQALTDIWHLAGRPTSEIYATYNQLWNHMKRPYSPSQKDYEMLDQQLMILEATQISWEGSFVEGADLVSERESYRIIDFLRVEKITDKKSGVERRAGFFFRFHQTHLKGLKSELTLPVSMVSRSMVKNKFAKAIHTFIERTLTGFIREAEKQGSKNIQVLSTDITSLIDNNRLVVENPEYYRPPSKQKQLSRTLAKHLNKIPLPIPGFEIRATAEEKTTGRGWKVTFKAYKSKTSKADINEMPNGDDKPKNSRPVNQGVLDLLLDKLGEKDNIGFYKTISMHYGHTIVSRALGELAEKELAGHPINDRHKYFTSCLHRIVHSVGDKWIKECGPDCKYRDG